MGYYFQKDLSTLLVLDFFGLDGSISICEVEVILGINRGNMGKSRLEAFSDGVIAIIITIMVLELKVPHGENFRVF